MRATPSVAAAAGLALVVALAVVLAARPAAAVQQTTASAWPQFRGPARDGFAAEARLLASWPADGPPRLWRRPLGDGYAGMAVVGDLLFTMFGRDGGEWLAAIATADGTTRWETRIDDHYRDGQGNGPRATPTIAGDIVVGLGARGALVALDRRTGETLWARHLRQDFGATAPRWGYAGSPLVDGDLVLVDAGGSEGAGVIALALDSGEEVWRALDTKAGYAAPVPIDVGGLRQTVFFTADRLAGVETATGRALWQLPWKTSYDVNAATPVIVPPDRLFVASGYGVGGALLQLEVIDDSVQVRELWRTSEMKNQFSTSVLFRGHLYGFDGSIFMCIEAATGERLWRTRGFGHGSLLAADGRLIVLSDDGSLALVEPSPAEYRELARVQLFDSRTWTMPSLADGKLYVRDQRELVALDLRDADRP